MSTPLLLSPSDVDEMIRNPEMDCVVLQGSYEPDAKRRFSLSRVTSALLFDLEICLDKNSGFSFALPTKDQFAEHVAGLGIRNSSFVVVYDAQSVTASAARIWWMFKIFGMDNVSILSGGLEGWKRHGLQAETGSPQLRAKVDPTELKLSFRFDLLCGYEDVKANCDSKEYQVVDTRAPGDVAAGTIPGAKNVFYEDFFVDGVDWKSTKELGQTLIEAGVDHEAPTIASCLIGVSACSLLFVSRLIGMKDVTVYDGSWEEWTRRENGGP